MLFPLFEWMANWWLAIMAPMGLLIWSYRKFRAGRPKDVVIPIVSALSIAIFVLPITWTSQAHQRMKYSVDVRHDLAPAPAMPGSQEQAWLASSSAMQKAITYESNGTVVLARRQSNRNPASAVRRQLTPANVQMFSTTSRFGGALGCTTERCVWADHGTIGVVIAAPNTRPSDLVRLSETLRAQIEIPSGRYHPYGEAGKFTMFLALLVVLLALSIVAHELAHAVVARLVGNSVLAICIGMGRTLVDRKLGQTQLLLRAMPVGGYIQSVAHSPNGYRWRQCLVWAAGPLSNLAIAIALSPTLGSYHPIVLANYALFVVNLIPFSKQIPELNRRVGTDGFQIIEFARGRRPYIDLDLNADVTMTDPSTEATSRNKSWLRFIAA
jgi:Peptidase family M50